MEVESSEAKQKLNSAEILCCERYVTSLRLLDKLDGWTKTKVHLIKTVLQINQALCTYLLRSINQHWIDYSE